MEQIRFILSISNSSNKLQITDETVMGQYELQLLLSFPFLGIGITIPAQKTSGTNTL